MSTGIEIKKKIAAKEEGVTIATDLNSLNFVGAGVNASVVSEEVTVTIPGSIGSTAYYLNQTVTQSPYKEFTSIPTTAAEQDTATTIASGATAVIGAYQTPAGVPNTTSIPAGLWQFFLHLYSNVASDDWDIYVEVYKRDLGGIETLLFTTDLESVTNMSTSTTMYLLDGVFPTTSLLTTDRIVVKVLATNTGSGSQTIHMVTEGSAHYSVGTTTLNQVVGAGSVTAVTGTAPIASSGGTTPAISISQATSSTDGYLSSADWNTFNSKRGQGIWGIANASGAYTYYTTLTLAMAAATSGQTIELFSDVTESTATVITLKNGVNINGNGHTYSYTFATGNCFIDNGVAVICTISDLNINRTNYTSGSVYVQSSTSSDTDWSNSKINITAASGDAVSVLGKIRNIWVKVTGNGNGLNSAYTSNAQFFKCYAEVTGSGTALVARTSTVNNCTAISVSGIGCYGDQSSHYDCYYYSSSNFALQYGNAYGCTIVSVSGSSARQANCYNCSLLSTSGYAVSAQSNNIHNCVIRSSSANAVVGTADIYTSSVYTDSASVTSGLTNICNYYNCALRTNWNNASGHLLASAYSPGGLELVNNFMQVANASAYILTASAAGSVKYSNNVYKGSTTAINTAVITQGITNTQDNQGNILL